MMKRLMVAMLLLGASVPAAADDRGAGWMAHLKVLADDKMEGRLTGTQGFDRAAAYVVEQFRALGMKAAGSEGFLQPVALIEQSLDLAKSSMVLTGAAARPVVIGEEVLLGTRVEQVATYDAPLVFIGYGLHMPEAGHDDFPGIDLKGKIAVVLQGGPKAVSGALRAHASRAEVWPALQRAGAVGMVTIANPRTMDVPWERVKLTAATPGMRLADPALNDAKQPFLTASFDPAVAEMLFAQSGRTLVEMLAIADKGEALPRFELKKRLSGKVAATQKPISSANVVAVLPGSDAKLAGEYVVLSAHLDHVGIGKPIFGDAVYNGLMDDASGVATLLETAKALKPLKPKRSILFVVVTAEERGLLGSRAFASKPTVTGPMVANLNLDMFLPLYPLQTISLIGAEESSLGAVSAKVATALGMAQIGDMEPERNFFVRSDQYNFVRIGVPAVFPVFGAVTSEEKVRLKAWTTFRYHAPSDDLSQPIEPAWAGQFNRYFADFTLAVANDPARPTWNETSFFKRFAAK